MMLTGVPAAERRMMPLVPLLALTLSVTVTLMVWVDGKGVQPIDSIVFDLDVIENAVRSSRTGGVDGDSIAIII